MKQEIKNSIENSLNKLADKVRRTKKQNDHIKKTTNKFVEIVRQKAGMSEIKWIGSTATNLSVNYKDKGFDVDAMLIWNDKSKEDLVELKFRLIDLFKDFGNKNYENAKVHNKKPVISVRFLNKDGNDKFHIDFVIAASNDDKIEFIYSNTPKEKNSYKILENESVEMVNHFIEKIDEMPEKQNSIVTLKWWNDNKTRNLTKDARLPSSLINEIVVSENSSLIIDLNMDSLEEIVSILEKKVFLSNFEPKWDYLRKMNNEQLSDIKVLANNLLTAFEKALKQDSSEDAISILKEFFDGLEISDDDAATAGGASGRAG